MSIKRILGESYSEFEERLNFYNKIKDNYKNADSLSKVWANIKFRKCRYYSKLYHLIVKLDPSIKD